MAARPAIPGSRVDRFAAASATVVALLFLLAVPVAAAAPAHPGLPNSVPVRATHATGSPLTDAPAALQRPAAAPPPPTTPPHWWDITTVSSTPFPILEFTQGTWDTADGVGLTYGGDNYGAVLGQTWSYVDGQWEDVNATGAPGGLDGPSLAYDASDGYVVMFGGGSSLSPFNGSNTTYTYAHGAWTAHALTPHPPASVAAQMAYDPTLGGVIYFGGANATAVLGETWLYKAGSWSQLSPAGNAPGRWIFTMAWDPSLSEVLLYGGYDAFGNTLGDTWAFANGTWTQQLSASNNGIPPLGAATMVFDPDLDVMVLSCGLDAFGNLQSGSWQFGSGGIWGILGTNGAPHGHDAGIGFYDPIDREMLLAGGEQGSSYVDVLTLPLAVQSISYLNTTDVGVPYVVSAQAMGGAPPYSYTWGWGDGTPATLTQNATHIYTAAETYLLTLTIKGPALNSLTVKYGVAVELDPTPTITVRTAGLDVGVPFTLDASAKLGYAPYNFSWSFTGGATAQGPSATEMFSAPGSYVVNLSLVDAAGGTAFALRTLSVNATPSVGVFPVNPPEASAITELEAGVTDGSPPYSYAWNFQGGGSAVGEFVNHTFTTAGATTVTISVTDADGLTASVQQALQVVPAVSLSVRGPTSLTPGSQATFVANASGGTAPYNYTWTLPGGSTGNGSVSAYYFGVAGTYQVIAHVVDANGVESNASLSVVVSSGSASGLGGSLGGVPTTDVLLIVVVVLVVAGIAVVMIRRRRPAPPPAE